jgi:hypothetical protein
VRAPFARVSLTAAVVWRTLALFLSIVASYAGRILKTSDLALLAAIAALAPLASSGAQIAERFGRPGHRDQAIGLVVLAAGLLLVVGASPAGSLALLVAGGLAAGAGHGLAFLNAQQELNEIAPAERRGEITAAFIAAIYAVVAGAVIATGALDRRFSLPASMSAIAVVLVLLALGTAAWQLLTRESHDLGRRPSPATHRQQRSYG